MKDHFYLNRQFDDFAAFEDSMGLWNVRMNQLHCGKSTYNVSQICLEKTKLNHLVFNGHKTSVGDPPRGKTFAFWSGENAELIWRKKRILPNNIMVYPQGAEHDVMTRGENIHVHTITFPQTVWDTALSGREAEVFHKKLLPQELISISDGDMLRLKQIFLSYFKSVDNAPDTIGQESFRKMVEEQILHEVKRVLSLAKENQSSRTYWGETQKIWGKIELLLKKTGGSSLPIKQLCSTAGVSERSLRRLFHDRYGVSPKNYIIKTRLNCVRQDLQKCSTVKSKVVDIANNHGFWHMGQFAADYRKLFGELPSETPRPTF